MSPPRILWLAVAETPIAYCRTEGGRFARWRLNADA